MASRVRTRTARPQPRILLNKQEAAIALGMSVSHFERNVQASLPCVYSGQLTLYRVRDLDRWSDAHAVRRLQARFASED